MDNCIFCKIVSGVIPASFEYQDELVVAFRDIHPSAPTHILVVPKKHVVDLHEAPDIQLLGHIQQVLAKLADQLQVTGGYKIVLNGGRFQEVKHLHYHLLGGMEEGGMK